ncbi:MAG: hypothetical protein KAI71_06435 [Candidatus Pacebacteria bacterium]|nr:hypothetical protein [Candidatus Paceibacterota bacterium]
MKKLRKEKSEGIRGNPPRVKMKMSKRTRIVTFVFSVITILTTAGIMQAANVYYDLDTSTIVMNEIINQTGAGQVTFSGNVDTTGGLDVSGANFTVGGGYGTTGVTISDAGVIQADGAIHTDSNVSLDGTLGIRESVGAFYTYLQGGDQIADVTYTLPIALPGASGYSLVSTNTGTMSWAASVAGLAHPLLGVTAHSDTVNQTVSQGSLVFGNATPAWDELVIGGNGAILRSDGTDVSWSTASYPNTTTINQLLFSSAANTVTGVTAGTTGQFLVASATGVPTFVTASGDATITNLGAITIGLDAVALGTDTTGNYVASVATGSGISGGAAGSEGPNLTLSLGDLTADWTQAGAFDIILGNADSQLQIMGNDGISYGIFDVGVLTANRTYTLPDKTGTVAMTSDVTSFGTTGVLVGQVNIFGFDYPAQCSASCDLGVFATISRKIITLPNFPAVLTGKTRSYKLMVRYADDLTANGNTTVHIWNTTTNVSADSFTIAGLLADGDLETGKVFLSDDLTIPLLGDDWEVRVGVPLLGDVIRIYSLELAAYDID